MIVTLDGPAGAGKSTLARGLARRLGWTYLDTGAMYRAVTWATLERGLDPADEEAIGIMAAALRLDLAPGPEGTVVRVDDHDVTSEIRSARVTGNVSRVAAVAAVRDAMVDLQRKLALGRTLVAEGRDMGTVVFPEAPLKVFVTASPAVRARRRAEELRAAGREVDEQALEQEIRARDDFDSNRAVAPLRPACDARLLVTDDRSIPELLEQLENWVAEISPAP